MLNKPKETPPVKTAKAGWKSLKTKIALYMGIPLILAYVLTGLELNISISRSVRELTNENLRTQSQAAAQNINAFFADYAKLAMQLSDNIYLQEIVQQSTTAGSLEQHANYAKVLQTLKNVHSRQEGLLAIFITSVASQQVVDTTGVNNKAFNALERPWFVAMQAANGTVLTEPYEDISTKKQVVTIASPIYKAGTQEIIGAIGLDLTLDALDDIIGGYTIGESGHLMLATAEGKLIYHPDSQYINASIAETDLAEPLKNAFLNKTTGEVVYTHNNRPTHGYVATVGDTGWLVASGLPEQELYQSLARMRVSMLLIFGITLVILIGILMLVLHSIVKPLRTLTHTANQIADGNLHLQLDIHTQDETGQLATALKRTVVRLNEYILYIQEITHVLKTMAAGDMRISLQQNYSGEFAPVKQALLDISASLSEVLSNIQSSAEQVDSGAAQMSNAAQALAAGATEQASSIEELSASITEISAKATHNTNNISKAVQYIEASTRQTQESNVHMEQMQQAMGQIDSSSGEIRKIIKAIDDIAFQTNILALNAAVEAARAGQAGKGFAVVADEVRNLAAKSAQAAKDTEALILASIASVKDGSRITEVTAAALAEVAENARQIETIMQEIRVDSAEQSSAIEQVLQGVEQISNVVQTNAATAEETSASSEQLSAQAVLLREAVGRFKLAATSGQPAPIAGDIAGDAVAHIPAPEQAMALSATASTDDKY